MPSWSGKTRGGISGYKFIIFIIYRFGLGTAYFFLGFVVFYFIITSPKSNRSSYHYFRKIHRYGILKSLLFIYRNYLVFGQTIIDKIAVMSGTPNRLKFTFDGEQYLHQLSEEHSGAMLLSAHTGSFEMAGYLLKRVDTPVNILMFEAEHEKIKHFLSGVYKDMRAQIIAMKDDMSHIYSIRNAFENREFLCLHGDRFVKEDKTLAVQFMSKKALIPAGPFYLATRFHVPVSFVFAMKERRFHYHFYATKPKIYTEEKRNLKNRELNLTHVANDYIAALEHIIRKYPTQWFNFYSFWESEQHEK